MRVPDRSLDELRERGYAVVEGFLDPDELAAAQEALWDEYPRPADYVADPGRYERFTRSQFAGLKVGPWRSWALNRLAFHPDLVDLATRFLGSADLRLYKTELWAKYAGAVDYDQPHHRDFGNHTLVVPDRTRPTTQMTSFVLLSDVTADDGPTMVVPFEQGAAIPYWPPKQAMGDLADVEVAVTGPAGSLFVYRTDILHRGSQIRRPDAARFVLLADYEVWGPRWTGKAAWPNEALGPAWAEMMERATPAERCLFGFPAPGDPYWTAQTVADVGVRYPQMDMTPYLPSSAVAPREGYRSVTPRIVVDDVVGQIEFLRLVFGATGDAEPGRPTDVRIGDSVVMVSSTLERGPSPAFLHVYVDDADEVFRRAVDAGATVIEAPLDTPYGDRRAMVRDPFGNTFQLAHPL